MSQLTIDQAMQIAAGHHQAGRLHEAEAIYRQILDQFPDHPDALCPRLLWLQDQDSNRLNFVYRFFN